jgi:hypothetical protein
MEKGRVWRRAAPRTKPLIDSGQNAPEGPKPSWGDGVGASQRRSGAPRAADRTLKVRFVGVCERGRAVARTARPTEAEAETPGLGDGPG